MKNIATALAKAQMEMGKALKSSSNPHFKSKYADLASVMDACMPALNAHGIAVISPTGEDEYGRFVETRFIHGESGEGLSCRVPLLVSKNDMQGFGSAVTYGRRYGLMSLAGIAPEDDDGNAAAKALLQEPANTQEAPKLITEDQFRKINNMMFDTETDEEKFCAYMKVETIEMLNQKQFKDAMVMLDRKLKAMPKKDAE